MNVETARGLYELVVETANHFLTAGRRFEVHVLQNLDPSFEELAEIMEELGKMVYDVMLDEDPHLASQSNDYVHLMGQLAIAIKTGNESDKDRLISELEQKSFIV